MGSRRGLSQRLDGVDAQEPALSFYGAAFWSAWLPLSFNGLTWAAGPSAAGALASSAARWAFIASLLLLALFHRRADVACGRRGAVLASGLASGIASAALVLLVVLGAGGAPVVACAVVVGAGQAFLLMRSALLFAGLEPRLAMLRYAVAEILAALVWLLVASVPTAAGACLFSALPALCGALLMLGRPAPRAAGAEGASLRPGLPLVCMLAVLLLMRFFMNINTAFTALPAGAGDVAQDVLALVLASAAIAAYALLASGSVSYIEMYRATLVATAVILIGISLVGGGSAVSGSVTAAASWVIAVLTFLVLTYVCHTSGTSVALACGVGYAVLFLVSTLGRILGSALAAVPGRGDDPWDVMAAIAYAALVLALVLFRPKREERLAFPVEPLRGGGQGGGRFSDGELAGICARLARDRGLTPREGEILALLARGLDAADIAESLGVSMSTARTHIRGIYSKLGVHSKKELAGLVEAAGLSGK